MDKKLGFGFMRLPLLDPGDQASFDYETINQMVDAFLERGFSYFDTAYVYHNYRAEEALRKSLAQRHNRDEFILATKLPMRDVKSPEEMEAVFAEQLQNCGVSYFDYYLLHNIGVNTYQKACGLDSFSFGLRKKREGRIRNFGMSFHDSPELLDEILSAHPELDFVQLQLNYIDWENPGIQSKRCHAVARKHGKPVIVMEPVKGGNLALAPERAEKLMKGFHPELSVASWAVRFAASQEGVIMVLSGMSTLEQLLDNTTYMADFKPLGGEEVKIIEGVTGILNENTAIGCTTCRYCEKGCPKKIAIPDYFALYNNVKHALSDNFSSQFVYYLNLAAQHGRAGECIACRKCESVCPQHLPIPELLKDVSAEFDTIPGFPERK